jgi:acyl carrier protein
VPQDEASIRASIAVCIDRVARSLDLPTAAFGPETTLSDLGLDSIHLMQFVMEIRRELKVNLRIRDFADATTIGAVTDLVLGQVRLQRISGNRAAAKPAAPAADWEEIKL